MFVAGAAGAVGRQVLGLTRRTITPRSGWGLGQPRRTSRDGARTPWPRRYSPSSIRAPRTACVRTAGVRSRTFTVRGICNTAGQGHGGPSVLASGVRTGFPSVRSRSRLLITTDAGCSNGYHPCPEGLETSKHARVLTRWIRTTTASQPGPRRSGGMSSDGSAADSASGSGRCQGSRLLAGSWSTTSAGVSAGWAGSWARAQRR